MSMVYFDCAIALLDPTLDICASINEPADFTDDAPGIWEANRGRKVIKTEALSKV